MIVSYAWQGAAVPGVRAVRWLLSDTACGQRSLPTLPYTWQASRPCKRCRATVSAEDWSVVVDRVPDFEGSEFYVGARTAMRSHGMRCLQQLELSKKMARQIANALGYVPAERLLDDYPDLEHKITYLRPPKGFVGWDDHPELPMG